MVTGRNATPFGAKPARDARPTAAGLLCTVALLSFSACADIWGFGELRSSPDGGATDGAGVKASGGAGGHDTPTGSGGVSSPANGGANGQGGTGGRAIAANGGMPGPGGGAGGGAGGGGPAGGRGGTAAMVGGGGAGARASGAGGGVSGSGGGGGRGGTTGSAGVGGAGARTSGATGGMSGSGGGGGAAAGSPGTASSGGRGGSGGDASGGMPVTGSCIPGSNQCVAGDLQVCSASGTWQSTETATRELLTNRAFEGGETGWMVSVAGGFPLVYAADGSGDDNTPEIAAQSSRNLAWFAGYNRADDILSQSVVLPANAGAMSISFYYAIFTREVSPTENDVMDVQLIAGTQTISLAHLTDNDPVDTWTSFTAPLPTGLAGSTVTLQFHVTTNPSLLTSFYVDTVSVQAVVCP
jgi:hypothetical protein